MAGMILRGAALLPLCLAGAAAAAQPATAQPSSAPPARWHLDGATHRCVLTRRLEGSPAAATFVLRTIPGSGRYDVILSGADLAANARRGRQARIGFGPDQASFAADTAAIDLPGDLGRGVAIGPLPAAVTGAFARAATLRLSDAGGRELGSWNLPIAGRAAQALAECEVEKQVEWGADRTGLEPGAQPPRPASDPHTWISVRDFNLITALAPASYTAVFRLVLDPSGRPTGCTLLEFAGNVDIEDDFCRALLHSARYEPARDARGNPVSSVAVQTLSFRMTTEFQWAG